jgi:hypothetical protein
LRVLLSECELLEQRPRQSLHRSELAQLGLGSGVKLEFDQWFKQQSHREPEQQRSAGTYYPADPHGWNAWLRQALAAERENICAEMLSAISGISDGMMEILATERKEIDNKLVAEVQAVHRTIEEIRALIKVDAKIIDLPKKAS